jgi:hypothetical protein
MRMCVVCARASSGMCVFFIWREALLANIAPMHECERERVWHTPCMCVCVCMYICICICTCVCVCACARSCARAISCYGDVLNRRLWLRCTRTPAHARASESLLRALTLTGIRRIAAASKRSSHSYLGSSGARSHCHPSRCSSLSGG